MVNPRFAFALEHIKPGDWALFEKFASEFLAVEFPGLRTTASPSGDRGRDAELITVDTVPRTAFQYSVTKGWATKIAQTVKRVTETFPGIARLIYCTNQEIGALFDSQREQIWADHRIQVDVRDRNWFIEHEIDNPVRATAAAELSAAVAEPILQPRKVASTITTPLTSGEAKVAFLQLALNSADNARNKSLTKQSFDSLVRAALLETSAETPRTRDEVRATVCEMLGSPPIAQIHALVDSALNRLSQKGGPIKHNRQQAIYHLSFQEAQAWNESAAQFLLEQEELENDLAAALYGTDDRLDEDPAALSAEAKKLRAALDAIAMKSGEKFAESILTDSLADLSQGDIAEEIGALDLKFTVRTEQAAGAILAVLAGPSDGTRAYLTRTLDAYTLLAFLQQTPDVQKTLAKVFDGGEIWLDTSAVLPLLAELALDEVDPHPYTDIMRAARDSGVELHVTGGALEEIRHHLDNCLRYQQLGRQWKGRVPFIFSAYILSGRPESELPSWIAEMKGDYRPEQDIAEFLEVTFRVTRSDLATQAENASLELRGAVQNLWLDAHSRRRGKLETAFGSIDRLVKHDVESVVGVIQVRRSRGVSPLGYSAWWLTLDGTAFRLDTWLKDQLGDGAPHSPVLSPDYLAQILRFGPLRRAEATSNLSAVPVSAEIRRFEDVPRDLIDLALRTRTDYAGFSELRIRREVRDALDRARTATIQSVRSAGTFDAELLDDTDAG